jgi:hypothetical protein
MHDYSEFLRKELYPLSQSYIEILFEAERTIFNKKHWKFYKEFTFFRNKSRYYNDFDYKISYCEPITNNDYSIIKFKDSKIIITNSVSYIDTQKVYFIFQSIHQEIQKYKIKKNKSK